MKKILLMLIVLAILLAAVSCGGASDKDQDMQMPDATENGVESDTVKRALH